jgi:glutathione S-transferase
MPYVALITAIALLQFFYFGLRVSIARGQYGVRAPAITGHEIFERRFRVQMNTLEQLIMFLPLLWVFAHFISPMWAAGFGTVFIVGRAIYAITYVREPKSRAVGFAMTALSSLAMALWIIVWAVSAILRGAA